MNRIEEELNDQLYRFLNGEITAAQLQQWLDAHPLSAEGLSEECWWYCMAPEFRDINVSRHREWLFARGVDEGAFETWRLIRLLEEMLASPDGLPEALDNCYSLYCGVLQEDGSRRYQYRFLGHIGLNYCWWLEEGYLRTTHGDQWEEAYQQALTEIPAHHEMLKPTIKTVLDALKAGEIRIFKDGTYDIPDALKGELE